MNRHATQVKQEEKDSFFTKLKRFLLRFRYPVSLPEEVQSALGIRIPNTLRLTKLLKAIQSPTTTIQTLTRYMPREQAEKNFVNAIRKERFGLRSHYAYYFSGTWIEFALHFDEGGRLRRLYLQHRDIVSEQGIELRLRELSS